MLARLSSLILIPTIIACPMMCHVGLCQGDGVDAKSLGPASAGCRCCHTEPTKSEHEAPGDVPRKSPCQGVCGGVVFEKPVELNHLPDFSLPLIVAVESSVSISSATQQAHERRETLHSRGNFGRFVRALHMSFLC